MQMVLRSLSVAVGLVLALGCGGSKEPAHDASHEGEHAEGDKHEGEKHEGGHEEGGEHHHPKMEGAIKSFHDVLAPVYHADKGPGRVDKACAATTSMKDEAAKVAAEPKGDAAAWKTDSDTLTKTVGDLETACKGDKAGVEPALEKVHDAFHALMEKAKG
ncbi:MAG: hypothetical protein HOV80_30360 [Polyangiaceae bacterium]|nr:hypothetical protein [Polyangiaceae bacterium]